MKIEHISIEGFLGLRGLYLDLGQVSLICGPNGSGKSTIRDAVSFALLGETCRGVRLKKDLGALLTDGAKDGSVEVTLDGTTIARSVRTGNCSTDTPRMPAALTYVLDPPRFAALSDNERRAFLLSLTGTQIDREAVCERMRSRGLAEPCIEEIAPMLRAGFGAASKEAARRATECKGAWREVTGETWGAKKAETWMAPTPDGEPVSPERVNTALGMAEMAEQAAKDALRVCAAKAEQAERAAWLNSRIEDRKRRIRELEAAETPDTESAARHMAAVLATSDKRIADLEAELSAAESNAHPPQGRISPCPGCGALLEIDAQSIRLAPPEPETPPPEAHRRARELAAALETARIRRDHVAAELSEASRRQAERRAELASGKKEIEAAEVELKKLSADLPDAPDTERLEADAKAKRERWRDLKERLDEQEAAGLRTSRAAKLAQDVAQWLQTASALAPDGIPAELLGEALGPVNDRLRESATATGWPQVAIGEDMGITVGGRAHALCSESERWRADAMLAEAISGISGCRLLVLDRIDVLDLGNRAALLRWAAALAGEHHDTIILLGTLKAAPELPEPYSVHWISGGMILERQPV